jgi:hypothetical protein
MNLKVSSTGYFKLYYQHGLVTSKSGRSVAQAVSRRRPIAAAWVRALVNHVEFAVDKAALWQVFSRYFNFPCPSFIPLISPQSLPIIQVRYNKWPQ